MKINNPPETIEHAKLAIPGIYEAFRKEYRDPIIDAASGCDLCGAFVDVTFPENVHKHQNWHEATTLVLHTVVQTTKAVYDGSRK